MTLYSSFQTIHAWCGVHAYIYQVHFSVHTKRNTPCLCIALGIFEPPRDPVFCSPILLNVSQP